MSTEKNTEITENGRGVKMADKLNQVAAAPIVADMADVEVGLASPMTSEGFPRVIWGPNSPQIPGRGGSR